MHDFGEQESWSPADVRRLYGLEHESMHDVPQAKREEVTREVFALFDLDHNGVIERTEFLAAHNKGAKLPDFGVGLLVLESKACDCRGLTRNSWGLGIMVTTSTSMRFIISSSIMTRVCHPRSL